MLPTSNYIFQLPSRSIEALDLAERRIAKKLNLSTQTLSDIKILGISALMGGLSILLIDRLMSLVQNLGLITPLNSQNLFQETCLFSTIKEFSHLKVCVIGPIMEEIAFRLSIQTVLLKKIPNYLLRKRLPSQKLWIDSKIATFARIILTAALFSSLHLTNQAYFSKDYMQFSLISTFISGLIYGSLNESKLDYVAACVAHIVHNSLVSLLVWKNC